jgi:hypothetical protein
MVYSVNIIRERCQHDRPLADRRSSISVMNRSDERCNVRLVFRGSKGSAAFTPVMVRRIQRKKITVGDDRTIAARGKIADSSTGP